MKPQHLITISGGSGCGKSTLVNGLSAVLGEDNILHIEHDMYYRPADRLQHIDGFINFDTPEALRNDELIRDLEALMAGQSVRLASYDFATLETGEGTLVEPRPIIMVEGIFVLAIPEIRNGPSVDIFMDVDGEIRLARRVIRDVIRQERSDLGKEGYEDDINYYLDYVKKGFDRFVLPHKPTADFVVDASVGADTTVERTLEFLRGRGIVD